MDSLSSKTVVPMVVEEARFLNCQTADSVKEALCGLSSDRSVRSEQGVDDGFLEAVNVTRVPAAETGSQGATNEDTKVAPLVASHSGLSQSFNQITPVHIRAKPPSSFIDHQAPESPMPLSTQPQLSRGEVATQTEVLRPYQELKPSDTADLVNTIQAIWENDPVVKENGVILLNAPHLVTPQDDITLPPPDYRFEATSQRVVTPARLRGSGVVVIKHESAVLRVKKPKFDPVCDLTPAEMEATFRDNIEDHEVFSRHPYFNIDISEQRVRPKGSFELTCGSPMDKLSYIAGMNTPYGYYSRKKSHFGAHIEDWHCASYNVLFAGATKLWIAVKPSSQHILEKKVREMFPEAGTCVQFIRHQALNLAPRLLREWGVEHFFVPQNPGQIVAVSGYTYHWGINTGQNYAEAINFCMERDWKAAADFRNCYPGCGINLDNLPLPKPVVEEGTMEEKKLRSFKRDGEFRRQWDIDVQIYEEKEGLTVPKKIVKKPRISSTRIGIEDPTARQQQSSTSVLERGGLENRVPDERRDKLRDRIAISAPSKKLKDGRGLQRRSMTQRKAYQNVESSADNSEDDDDDQPPEPKARQTKPLHSRHNSTHIQVQGPAQQADMGALLAEMKLMRGFFTEQKAVAIKNEEHKRTQLAYQKRQADDQRRQLEISKTLLQVLMGIDHRLMLATQAMETRSLQSTPRVRSAAPSEIYAQSATTSNNEHSATTSNNGHNATHPLHRRLISTDSRVNHVPNAHAPPHYGEAQIHFQGRAPPVHSQPSLARQHWPTPDGPLDSMATASHKLVPAPAPSAQASRRSSSSELSEPASELSDCASPEYSSIPPEMKSFHSTPQLDVETASSAPSSLSEPVEESVILVQPQVKTHVLKAVDTEGEPESSQVSEASDSDYAERTRKNGTPKAKSAATPGRRGSTQASTFKRRRCTNCAQRRKICDQQDPTCTNCAEWDDENVRCVYPPRAKAASSKRNAREVSEAISVEAKRPRTAASSTTPELEPSKVSLVKEPIATDEQSGTKPDRSAPTKIPRELMSLFSTDGSCFDQTPGDRRARSKALQV